MFQFVVLFSCLFVCQIQLKRLTARKNLGLGTRNSMDFYTTYYFLLVKVLANSIGGVTLPALLLYFPRILLEHAEHGVGTGPFYTSVQLFSQFMLNHD